MAKKGRLGSDPLNWIGDSRETETTEKNEPRDFTQNNPEKSLNTNDKIKKTENGTKQNDKAPKKKKKKDIKVENLQPTLKEDETKQAVEEINDAPVPAQNKLEPQSMDLSTTTLEQESKQAKTTKKNSELEGKYLTFVLAQEDYGIVITKVKEIIGLLPITRVPRTPDYVCGVINLRGKIVSIIDMRLKFGMEQTQQTKETVIIVIQTKHGEKGIIVDRVSEVLNISAENIEPVPEFGASIDTEYILGMGKTDQKVKILLDIEKILETNNHINH